jgi:hypothetical protein
LRFKSNIEREMGFSNENKQFYVSYTQKHGDLTVKNKVKQMSDRLKVLGVFALLGFLGGIAANIGYKTVWPWLVESFPLIFASAEWIISGIAGALIAMFVVVIWVYLSKSNE